MIEWLCYKRATDGAREVINGSDVVQILRSEEVENRFIIERRDGGNEVAYLELAWENGHGMVDWVKVSQG